MSDDTLPGSEPGNGDLLDQLTFDGSGLIAAVIQDAANREVLMVGYMNREALRRTLQTGRVTFWSRSRQKYWVKGETSGNVQVLREARVDCDMDCLLLLVDQTGPACHEGYRSCFFRTVGAQGELHTNAQRLRSPEEMYGQR